MHKKQTHQASNQQGAIIVSILIVTMFLTSIIFSLIVLANANLTRARGRVLLLQAQYAAESGADSAIAELNSGNITYAGTPSEIEMFRNTLYRSTYTVNVVDGANDKEKILTATGKVYAPATAATARHSRTIKVTAQRSAATTASSILSRNIIDIQSGVKTLKGKDIYVNDYIHLEKTQTTLIGENITVAGKKTGAGNCSISGVGSLAKPTTFTDPAQTKTKITTAFNNCITPPGNTSNADFDVLPNQNTLAKIHSTYIPWDYYMDSTYQPSAAGCNDWTSGTFPREIPSPGNTKKTHYPDNGDNISIACGNSGDLFLESGQYTIKDHVHLRANMCAATACQPTFYNPDTGAAGLKYVFVEGSINFSGISSAAGSGPIIFVSYGTDPASKASVCPLGGAVYFGNTGKSSAPALFFLAMNGICLDKIKYDPGPALGGISGKNIYVSSNPGTPHDLELDPNFPVGEIPIDLAWRAVRYQRR